MRDEVWVGPCKCESVHELLCKESVICVVGGNLHQYSHLSLKTRRRINGPKLKLGF